MSALNDEIKRATGGATVNEGLSSWFSRTNAENLGDAERRWLRTFFETEAEFVDCTLGTPGVGWTANDADTATYIAGGGSIEKLTGIASGMTSGKIHSAALTISSYAGSGDIGFDAVGGIDDSLRASADGVVSGTFISDGAAINLFGRSTNSAVLDLVSVKSLDAPGSINDLWYGYLRALGYTGSLNDMKLSYWSDQP